MKDLCIPIPNFSEKDEVEVEVKYGNKKLSYNFKVVSFPWEEGLEDSSDELIISGHDLINIYCSSGNGSLSNPYVVENREFESDIKEKS